MPDPKPHITPALVDYLERINPDRCPNVSTPDREVWMAAGAAGVTRHLRALMATQAAESRNQGN